MNEEIKIKETKESGKMPKPHLSISNLEIEVEEGRVYRGSFVIESENKVPVSGMVCSTNDKVDTEIHEFKAIRQEIPYYFKGKLSVAGSEFTGDIVLITNGGEFNIPFHVQVVNRSAQTSVGKISDMEGFMRLYKENRTEAVSLFFLKDFPAVFLKDEPEKQQIYHCLLKSRQRNIIVEEFLVAAGYKPPVRLEVTEKKIVLDVGREEAVIDLMLTAPGYTEGRISSLKGQLDLSIFRFNSDYFENGLLHVSVKKNQNHVVGSDVVVIETVRQRFEIPVEWWGTLPVHTKERERESGIRRRKADLMHNYLYFRTGSIGYEDFIESSGKGVEDLYDLTGQILFKMYRAHLYLMEKQYEAAKNIIDDIEQAREMSQTEYHYLLYLKAMYERTPEAISKAVVSIRRFYEMSDQKAQALWMLLYLDREYVYNKKLTFDTIQLLFEHGENSSLLYFEACEILNANPAYMKDLGVFPLNVFRWGLRYGYVSLPLSYQFARLAMNYKYYNPSIYHMAVKLYKVEPDDLFLSLICSQLIKGNKTGREYHKYYRKAVLANLKIIGLNEFFIRSMDVDNYDIIPQRVLIYFTYSNSLDYLEKAYLYTNVLKHKEEYEEVYGAYHSKMIPFVTEQLVRGRINEHLASLYTHFQKEILEVPENWKAVCDILFCKRLICRNPYMVGVYVTCPETGDENYYPLSGGQAVVETYNRRTILSFVDKKEQRYIDDIDYECREFLSLNQFSPEWKTKNLVNHKVLLVESVKVDQKVGLEELSVLQKIALDQRYLDWIRTKAVEKLLTYYENHQNKEDLTRWLEKIDYGSISPSFRKTLMDYYMEVGMIENTFFGVELYGCTIMGAEKRLKLAEFGINHYNGELDETTLFLAYSAFIRRKNTRKTLAYLMKHFQGETEDLLTIWERSRKFELETEDFEKRILIQSVFADNDTDGVFPVYRSFYEKKPDDEMSGRYLEYALEKEMNSTMVLPDYMHMIIGRQIESGNIESRSSKINFLYYFADRPDWHERISKAAASVIQEFLKEDFYLPVFHKYSDFVTLPIRYEEMSFVSWKGQADSKVVLCYEVEGEENSYQERRLTEVLPGLYVTGIHLYQKDQVHYRLEENDTPVENEEGLLFESFDYEGEDSRFFALNHLAKSDADPMELDDYLIKAFFADTQPGLL